MDFGSLTKGLMQKTMRLAGDGAKSITIIRVSDDPTYDPETGETETDTTEVTVPYALCGAFTEAEMIRYKLVAGTEKIVFARADIVELPEAEDYVEVDGDDTTWRITKVIEDIVGASVSLAVIRGAEAA